MSYLPTPNSPLDRALTYLRTLPPGAEVSNALLAEVIKCPAKQNHSSFKAGIAAGLIYGRQKVPGGRSPVFWSLTDHSTPATTPATTPSTFPRSAFDAPPKRVEGSGIRVRGGLTESGNPPPAKPTWIPRQALDLDDALAQIKADQDTPQPAAQQVLKAEAATPDATDRAAPAHASPGVGPMGVGQSADADPSGEPAPANTPWLHMRGIPWPVPVETAEPPLFTPQRHYLPSAPLFAGLEPDDRTAKQIIEDVAPQEAPRAERASTPPPVFHVSSDGEFRITRGGIETERLPWEHAVALFDFLRVRNLA